MLAATDRPHQRIEVQVVRQAVVHDRRLSSVDQLVQVGAGALDGRRAAFRVWIARVDRQDAV